MTFEAKVRVEERIQATPAAVWARVSDHEGVPAWIAEVKSVTLTEKASPEPGGVGAIRRVVFKPRLWSTVHERITEHRRDERFHYTIVAGMPALVGHEGRIIVEPLDGGTTRVRWEVDFTFRSFHPMRPFLPSIVRQFGGVLQRGLTELKRQIEARPNSR